MNNFIEVTKILLSSFLEYTVPLFVITLVASIPLGLLFAFASMSKIKWVSRAMQLIIWVVRGVPLMLLVILLYNGPGILSNGKFIYSREPYFDALIPISIAFIINYACYFSEIFRGGIESIPKGQYEACQVLGMTKAQAFFKVVLVQLIKKILPATSNEVMTLIKDTALANVTGSFSELILTSQKETIRIQQLWPLFYTAVFYLAAVGIFTLIFKFLEKKLNYFKA